MASDNFNTCLAFTLRQEGDWSDNPNDPGGCTMEGVTIATYRSWKHDNTLSCNDLRGISSDEVAAIYEQNYWNPVKGDQLPIGVSLMVWDMAVNAGVGASVKILQSCLKVVVDGGIGPQTLAAVANIDNIMLIHQLAQHQSDYYRALPKFNIFGTGWLNRVNARHAAALSMATNFQPNVQQSLPVAERVDVNDNPPPNFWNWLV